MRNFETNLKSISGNTISPDPFPGSPVIKSIDKVKKIVVLSIALSGEQTQSAFKIACDVFNEEVLLIGWEQPVRRVLMGDWRMKERFVWRDAGGTRPVCTASTRIRLPQSTISSSSG